MSNDRPLVERAPTALEETRLSIPLQDRKAIEGIILEVMSKGYRGQRAVQEVCLLIVSQMFAGNIQPDTAKAAQPFVEMFLTSVTAEGIERARKGEDAPNSVEQLLLTAQNKMGAYRPAWELTDEEPEPRRKLVELEEVNEPSTEADA